MHMHVICVMGYTSHMRDNAGEAQLFAVAQGSEVQK